MRPRSLTFDQSIIEEEPYFIDKKTSSSFKKINNGIEKVNKSVNFENRMKTDSDKFKSQKELAKIDEEPDMNHVFNENQFKVEDSLFEITEMEHTDTELDIEYHNSKFRSEDLLNLSLDMPSEAVEIDSNYWSLDDQIKNMTAKVVFLAKRFTRIKEKHEKEIEVLLKLIKIERKKYQTTSSKNLGLVATSIKDFKRLKSLMV